MRLLKSCMRRLVTSCIPSFWVGRRLCSQPIPSTLDVRGSEVTRTTSLRVVLWTLVYIYLTWHLITSSAVVGTVSPKRYQIIKACQHSPTAHRCSLTACGRISNDFKNGASRVRLSAIGFTMLICPSMRSPSMFMAITYTLQNTRRQNQ